MPRLQLIKKDARVAQDGDVFIAGLPSPAAYDAWKAEGVGTVINLLSRAETAQLPFKPADELAARGMAYHEIPMGGADGASPQITAKLGEALAGAEGKVVVHCRSGTRVANAYAASLLVQGKIAPDQLADFGWPGGLDRNTLMALLPR